VFRSGTWVLVLTAAAMAAAVAWRAPYLLKGLESRAHGDGQDPTTYGFDLDGALIPADQLIGGGVPREFLRALDEPPVMSVSEMEAIRWSGHGHAKMLVSDSRVIGVQIDGIARAYPLSVLNWHEVVNDTVAGHPIVVAYNPLSDAAAVFARRPDQRYGFSGLLHQSSSLIHDRQTLDLVSPLLGRVVAGPAVGEALIPVQAALVRWGDWVARHPDTEILKPDLLKKKLYKRKPYESYRGSDRLRFPVEPLPPQGLENKASVVAVEQGDRRAAWSVDEIYGHAGEDGRWEASFGGEPLVFETGTSPTVFTQAPDGARVVHCYRFAWHALHPTW